MVRVHRTGIPTYAEAVWLDQEELYEWSTLENDVGEMWLDHAVWRRSVARPGQIK
jgi:hypothetical protein